MNTPAQGTAGSPTTGYGSRGYRGYVLFALLVVYTFNFIDRIIIQILAEPIIREFQLYDWQFGLLSGFGFALLYTIMGIPIARLAETRNRVTIIAISVLIWSGFTVACGFATGFLVLLMFRVGVGIGEAGCTPPANSLISDYFIPKKRATAFGIYAMGITLGSMFANLYIGTITNYFGFITERWGFIVEPLSWREAFIYVGLPGILLAIIVKMTIKEPPRGFTDPPGGPKLERVGFLQALNELRAKPSFWTMSAGATLAAFAGYGIFAFQTSFFIRNFSLGLGEAAIEFNVPLAVSAALGTFLLGYIADKITPRHPNAIAWLPGLGLLIATPLFIIGFNMQNATLALVILCVASLSKYGYLGAQYAIGAGVASMRTRATAIAILLFIINLIGYGLGPIFSGAVSDFVIVMTINASEAGQNLTAVMCKGDLGALETAQGELCRMANARGMRLALTATSGFYLLAAIMFFLSARTLQRDLVAK